MSRFFLTAFLVALSAAPFSAEAAWTTTLSLAGSAPQGEWGANNANLSATAEGMRIQANPGGAAMLLVTASHPIDAVRITYANGPTGPSSFAWHRLKDPQGSFYEIGIPQGIGGPDEITVPVSTLSTWDRNADIVALGFPSGEDVVVSQIELSGWSFKEKVWYGFTSIFYTDRITAYSINFLWGPLVNTDPVALENLFDQQPPPGLSVNRFLYGILFLVAVLLFVWSLWSRITLGKERNAKAVAAFFLATGFLWILYDLRMGLETSANFLKDLRSYTFTELGKKEFRNQQNFNDLVEQSLPVLKTVDRFTVLVPDGVPIAKYVYYTAYPEGKALEAGRPLSDADAILIFRRDDITVDAQGRLLRRKSGEPEVLSFSGSIVEQFDATSFLYRKAK